MRRIGKVFLVFIGLIVLSAFASNPLASYFAEPQILSKKSVEVSISFNRAIVYLPEIDRINWHARIRVLSEMTLPDVRESEAWWQQYKLGLSQTEHTAFSLKVSENLQLPCIVSIGQSFNEQVKVGGYLNRLTEYNYHPYKEKPELYHEMVFWHEIGHCFESLGEAMGEVYADIFMLNVFASKSRLSEILELQIRLRWLELLEGDDLHFTAEAIELLEDSIRQNQKLSFKEIPRRTHQQLKGIFDKTQNGLLAKQQTAKFYQKHFERSDEALKYQHRPANSKMPAATTVVDSTKMALGYLYQTRLARNDFYNELQISQFRKDMNLVLTKLELDNAIFEEVAQDDLWLEHITTLADNDH